MDRLTCGFHNLWPIEYRAVHMRISFQNCEQETAIRTADIDDVSNARKIVIVHGAVGCQR
jgi:hypothetical protein